jgi:rod shape-determining protein MreC
MRDSRRARFVLAILLLIAVTFVVLDLRGGSTGTRNSASTVFGPLERGVASITRPVGRFFGSLTRVSSDQNKIDALERRNAELQTQMRDLDNQAARAAQLKRLLKVAGIGQLRIVPAQVIAIGPTQGFAWTVTIDAGRRDGVRVDQTVMNADGLVGRVTSAGSSTATVLLAIDPTSSVGARVAGSGQIGIVQGQGLRGMSFQLLDSLAPLAPGADIVTFGSKGDRPFVPGIPIGTVTKVKGTPGSLTRIATIRPFVDYSAVDVVGVVVGIPPRDPRDSLLPSTPTPAPTVTVTVTAPATPQSPGATPSPSKS